MTNEQFGAKIGVDFSLASRLRNGKRLPTLPQLWRISKAFKLPAKALVEASTKGPEAFGKYLRTHIKGLAVETDQIN